MRRSGRKGWGPDPGKERSAMPGAFLCRFPPWVTGSFSEQVWRVDILRTVGPVYSNMDQEAAWKLR